MLVTLGWLMTGCSSLPSMNPVNWWHRQEGGKIAEERPAPPGADQPYPNMSTVPPRPAPPDQEALTKLTASLVADRTNAQHAAESAPLADPSSPVASPGLFGVGGAPPPPSSGVTSQPSTASGASGTPIASASLPAVTAPATAPSPGPRKAVQSAPLEAPSAAVGSAATAGKVPTAAAGDDMTVAGPTPSMAEAPPPRPGLAGATPVTPVLTTPMPATSANPSATIVFPERASNLAKPETDEVKAFAAKRGNSTISVTGYGDSISSNPDAQSAALNLGLSRAQSIVDALKADGVPGNAIRVSAEASGRGALLQLLH